MASFVVANSVALVTSQRAHFHVVGVKDATVDFYSFLASSPECSRTTLLERSVKFGCVTFTLTFGLEATVEVLHKIREREREKNEKVAHFCIDSMQGAETAPLKDNLGQKQRATTCQEAHRLSNRKPSAELRDPHFPPPCSSTSLHT